MDTELLALIFIAIVVVFVVMRPKGQKQTKRPKTTQTERQQEPERGQEQVIVPAPPPAGVKDGDTVVIVSDGKERKGKVRRVPQGLQVWDENGDLVLDITDVLTSVKGTLVCNKTNGRVRVPGLNGRNIWVVEKESDAFEVEPHNSEWLAVYPVFPLIRVEGDDVIWEYPEIFVPRDAGHSGAENEAKYTFESQSTLYGRGEPVRVVYEFGVI